MKQRHIAFISTMELEPWGGSEELWSRAAVRLIADGSKVTVSVHESSKLHDRIRDLSDRGVDVRPRHYGKSFVARAVRQIAHRTALVQDVEKTIGSTTPHLVVISEGAAFPPIELIELCISKGWPFATIMHANCDQWWVKDEIAARYRMALPQARRCFFVAEANRALEEKQLGFSFRNSEIIRNPVNVKIDSPIPWPSAMPHQELRMACVARLAPSQKGQDLLIEALAGTEWRARKWRLALCGIGPNRECLELLIQKLNLSDRVVLEGYRSVEQVWRENHILSLPSRFEGVPISAVEAMLCGRPVLATNVGGNPELIEDGVTGFLAKCPSVDALREALDRMWERLESLQQMGNAAAGHARTFIQNDPVVTFAEKLSAILDQ